MHLRLIAATTAVLSIAPIAHASALKTLLTGDAAAQCYMRSYSSAHLSSHPDQITKSMRVKFSTIKGEKKRFGFMIEVKVRGGDKRYITGGLCNPSQNGASVSCFVECDAGQFTVSERSDQSILLHISREIIFSCEGRDLFLRGKDDVDFRLDSAPESECSGIKIPE